MNKRTVLRSVAKKKATPREMPVVSFAETEEWSAWLASRHHSSIGVWVKIAKKVSGQASITYAEALDVALAWGWIDGQKGKFDEAWWLQKFTPRGPRSMWSKINRERRLPSLRRGR